MKTFQDNEERTWDPAINVDAVKRVKALLEVDLLDVVEGTLLERLVGDPVLLCDVIYALCKPQADADGVSDEDFGRAMAGDVIDDATTAFLENLVDFFPLRRRRLLEKALAKHERLEAMAMKAAQDALDSPALERLLEKELAATDVEEFVRKRLEEARRSGGPSTDSQEPSASSRAHSPSES